MPHSNTNWLDKYRSRRFESIDTAYDAEEAKKLAAKNRKKKGRTSTIRKTGGPRAKTLTGRPNWWQEDPGQYGKRTRRPVSTTGGPRVTGEASTGFFDGSPKMAAAKYRGSRVMGDVTPGGARTTGQPGSSPRAGYRDRPTSGGYPAEATGGGLYDRMVLPIQRGLGKVGAGFKEAFGEDNRGGTIRGISEGLQTSLAGIGDPYSEANPLDAALAMAAEKRGERAQAGEREHDVSLEQMKNQAALNRQMITEAGQYGRTYQQSAAAMDRAKANIEAANKRHADGLISDAEWHDQWIKNQKTLEAGRNTRAEIAATSKAAGGGSRFPKFKDLTGYLGEAGNVFDQLSDAYRTGNQQLATDLRGGLSEWYGVDLDQVEPELMSSVDRIMSGNPEAEDIESIDAALNMFWNKSGPRSDVFTPDVRDKLAEYAQYVESLGEKPDWLQMFRQPQAYRYMAEAKPDLIL